MRRPKRCHRRLAEAVFRSRQQQHPADRAAGLRQRKGLGMLGNREAGGDQRLDAALAVQCGHVLHQAARGRGLALAELPQIDTDQRGPLDDRQVAS